MKTEFKLMRPINSRAHKGQKNICLPLYRGQVRKLKCYGFSVKILHKVSSPKGEFMCLVSWDKAKPGSYSFTFLITAEAKYFNNKKLFANNHIFIR